MDMADLSVAVRPFGGGVDPIRKLSSVFSKVKRAGAAADRVFELIDKKTLVVEPGRSRGGWSREIRS